MAELTKTAVGGRVPFGNLWAQTYRVTAVPRNTVSTNNWITTDFQVVDAVIGGAIIGADPGALGAKINTQDISSAEGTANGDVAVVGYFTTDARDSYVTVAGRIVNG